MVIWSRPGSKATDSTLPSPAAWRGFGARVTSMKRSSMSRPAELPGPVLGLIVLLAFLLAIPASADLADEIQAVGLDPEEILQPMRLDAEMRTWVAQKVPRSAPEVVRLKILLESLQHSGEIDFEYQAGFTGTAREVFHSGRFNCLSFSILFVSLARELGLPAFFLMLDDVERYEKEGDLIVASQHITAGYGFVRDRTILEFDVGPEINYQLAEQISDIDALALFFSNRGAEMLRDGSPSEALKMQRIATLLGPDMAPTWTNLGVTQRRLNDLEGAQESYVRALEADRHNLAAYENMIALLRLQGETHLADEMLPLLARRRNRNPYTYLTLGDLSLRDGRPLDAEKFFRRAFRLARFEAETHAAMGLSALARGEKKQAQEWLDKALKIDAGNLRTHRLQQQLSSRETPPQPEESPSAQIDK